MKALWIDGGLYTFGAIFIFTQGFFSTDEPYKYVDPLIVFWVRYLSGALAAGLAALKGFRSMTFARHNQQTQTNDKTA